MFTAIEIAKALGGRCSGRGHLACCPAHEDRTPSLSVMDGKDGHVLVHCFAGCDARDVIAALRDLGLWNDRSDRERPRVVPVRKPPRERNVDDDLAWANAILRASHPITGTLAARYLQARGLDTTDLPSCLRFHPCLWHKPTRQNWSAMVVPLRDIRTNEITGVHRTYLAPDGSGKAPIAPQRMVLGRRKGACIKLTRDEDVAEGLHIGEGIETCLRCMQRDFAPPERKVSTKPIPGRYSAGAKSDCPQPFAGVPLEKFKGSPAIRRMIRCRRSMPCARSSKARWLQPVKTGAINDVTRAPSGSSRYAKGCALLVKKQRARSTRKASASSLRACSSEFDMPPARGRHHTPADGPLLSAQCVQ
jgi:putative DNA primase/helicase